ncbi:DUF2057 family protein [Vibrio metschnikovii]|uniref:DUF2057 family protein n=1 Tax=Vibrio metschnikovii TaxID=28172 RepID=UPI002FC7EC24|nr:DUF2057 family protein [Vibrio metschnikovii]
MISLAHAQVQLVVPEAINLSVVNLEKPRLEGGLFSSNKTLVLPNGTHQIAFRYSQPFVNRDTVETVSSELVILKFNAENQKLTFQLPDYRNAQQARREIDHFTWQLIDTTNQRPVEQTSDIIAISGFVLGQNFIDNVIEYNKQSGKASISMSYLTVDNHAKSIPSHSQPLPTADEDSLVSQLQQLYLQANQQQKAVFRQWISQQE